MIESLRQSLVNTFYRCPLQAWFYLHGGPQPPLWVLRVGTWGHDAVDLDCKSRIETGEQIKRKDFIGVFEEHFDKEVKEILWRDESPGEIKDRFLGTPEVSGGVNGKQLVIKEKKGVLPVVHGEHLPLVEPILSEDYFEVEFPANEEKKLPDTTVTGTLDFYGKVPVDWDEVVKTRPKTWKKQYAIGDWKFRKASSRKAKDSIQLTMYGLVLEAKGKKVDTWQEHVFVHGLKGGAKTLVDETTRTGEDYERVGEEFQRVKKQMDHLGSDPGMWPMTNPDNWWCSMQSCGWAHLCPRFGGKYK